VVEGLRLSVPLLVFNETEALTVDAIASRIFPSDDQGGGGHEAEVVVYIDRTLEGHSRHLQALYRDGLRQLDHYCSSRFGGRFAGLSEGEQDDVLRQLDSRTDALGELGRKADDSGAQRREEGAPPPTLRTFFDVIWEHTVQGMFCDPVYGGNKDGVGWKMLGFPGAQWSYSQEQRARGFDATTVPIRTLADLQRERPWERLRAPREEQAAT
jgi:gluconate 2-dehydrogenase gamma chain